MIMKFNFDEVIDRVGQDAKAVNDLPLESTMMPTQPKPGFDAIPMWVADMSFASAPSVLSAISKRLQHPLFPYFNYSSAYYDAIFYWQEKMHGVTGLKKEHIGYENSVLGGLSSALKAVLPNGGKVLLHSPTYIGFLRVLKLNGYEIVDSPLYKDESGCWRMDLKDMEEKIVSQGIQVMIFCSPHNPSGRVWEKEELVSMMDLVKKHDVIVLSDEIWSDLVLTVFHHIPLQSIGEDAKNRTIAFYAPSKTFNLAGLIGSYHIIYNSSLKEKVDAVSSATFYNGMNVLSMHGLIGAYSEEGYQWCQELNQILQRNIQTMYDFLNQYPEIEVSMPQGTYLLFVDMTNWLKKHPLSLHELLQRGWDVGVGWQNGEPFLKPNCIRINIALPYSKLLEAIQRLKTYVLL